jgi:DNA-binding MarR family transcriptional regulator
MTDPERDVDPLALLEMLTQISRQMERSVDSALRAAGLTARHVMVLYLIDADDVHTPSQLVAALRTHRTTVFRLLADLEQQGLVHSDRTSADLRVREVRLTSNGRNALRQSRESSAAAIDDVVRDLPTPQVLQLYHLLIEFEPAHHRWPSSQPTVTTRNPSDSDETHRP